MITAAAFLLSLRVLATCTSFVVYPATASVQVSKQQTFQGQYCGTPYSDVYYSVDGVVGGNYHSGFITPSGVYTAPTTNGTHVVKATDSRSGAFANSYVIVYEKISIDYGYRTFTSYPIAPGLFGTNHAEYLSNYGLGFLTRGGINQTRSYAQIQQVFASSLSSPNWTMFDGSMKALQQAGIHPILQLNGTPNWLAVASCLQSHAPSPPSNVTTWARIAAMYVQHLDRYFPGLVTDYEIWNEPNLSTGMCGSNVSLYISIYTPAAKAIKQQAAADRVAVRVGGPSIAGLDSSWIQGLTTGASAPYVDFISYHQYMFGPSNLGAKWDQYNDGSVSVYQQTQDSLAGSAGSYAYASYLVKNGKQPLAAKVPIYVDEYNLDYMFADNCCSNNQVYSPLWNGLYVNDILNTVYDGRTTQVPGKLSYYAATAYPYFCMIGEIDSAMDCKYSWYSTAVAPYPQYYLYELYASANYLNLQNGGYLAKSVSPGIAAGGLVVSAFFTPGQDSAVIVNPTAESYDAIEVDFNNSGLASGGVEVYQIVNGNTITSQNESAAGSGGSYRAVVNVPAYSVVGVSLK